MDSFIEAFLLAKRADCVSANTVIWHTNALLTFQRWIEHENKETEPSNWTLLTLREYVVYLRDSRLADWTVTGKVQSLKAFVHWLYVEELIPKDIQERLKKPAPPQQQTIPFTESELMRLLTESRKSLLHHTMVSILIDTGIRANELCTLKASDLILAQGLIKVLGKGNKVRIVPVSVHTAKIVSKYVLKEHGQESEFLFLTRQSNVHNPHSLHKLLIRLGERAGVQDVHPHKFRHTFALLFLRNGGDSLILQRLHGHTSLTMTNRYVNMTTIGLQRAHQRFSPLDGLLKR